MPMSARRPSTMNSFLPAEVPQNCMAVQQRLQISELQFDEFSTPSSFSYWKITFKTPGDFLFCGEVEDVVGALTPFGRGVAQVFHDLLVELAAARR